MVNVMITPKTSLIIPLSQRLNSYKSNDNIPNIKYIQATKSMKCFSLLKVNKDGT